MKKLLFISCFVFATFFTKESAAQFKAGPLAGSNLSILNDFTTEKQVLRPGIYAGLYSQYSINGWLSFGAEAAWSERSITYHNLQTYSAFGKLQQSIGQVIPGMPDFTDIIELITGTSALAFNDTVFEHRSGIVTFKSVEVPLVASFSYKKLSIDAGGYVAFLTGAVTESKVEQDIPFFDVFSPDMFNNIFPFLSTIIYGAFPSYSKPTETTTYVTKGFNSTDYGLIGGISYHPDDFWTIRIRYSHGLAEKLSPDLPESRKHSAVRVQISYNIFGKFLQKPMF